MNNSKLGLHRLKVLALGLTLAVFSVAMYAPRAAAETASANQSPAATSTSTTRIGEPGADAMVVDGLIVRPVSLVGTVLGTAAFLVTLPFSAIGGNVGEAGHAMVVEPFKFTFARPLGQFSENSLVNK